MQLALPELLQASPETTQQRGEVFCNRNLRLDSIELIGFDMDYTLAIYRQEEIDRLSIEATVKKLVERGYPKTLLSMPYRTDFAIRGLVVDRKRGNILKMDRYRYVKRAYHGFRELTLEERRQYYHSSQLRLKSRRYHWVDTLYALSELSVFAAVVEEIEQQGGTLDYDKLFSDVRYCIDLAHRDGSILDVVVADLPKYVERDPKLADTLHRLRSSGKKLMLLTNSRAAYTDKMMHYLIGESRNEYASWRNYFDYVVTAAQKPGFFEEDRPFRVVDMKTGHEVTVQQLERGKMYAGGSLGVLRKLLGIPGDRVLYVGDHIYGDVLRPKKTSAWRTAMVMQEMKQELDAQASCVADILKLHKLEKQLDRLQDELRDRSEFMKLLQQSTVAKLDEQDSARADKLKMFNKRVQEQLRSRIRILGKTYADLENQISRAFHPLWGPIFKCGPETSLLGEQIERYACIYMARVSDLLSYSPNHYFRSPRHQMPHETLWDAGAEEDS